MDLKNRILEYEQNSHDAVREFKKFKVHTQGDISMRFHCTRNINNNHVHATRCQSSDMFKCLTLMNCGQTFTVILTKCLMTLRLLPLVQSAHE